MKKILALLTFFTGGSLLLFFLTLPGCVKRDHSILYKDIFTKVIRYQSNGLETPLTENDTVHISDCFLETGFDITQLSSHFPLPGNAAWAFQPGEQYYKPVEKISGIHISPLQKFNNNYTAGVDMTASCRFRFGGAYNETADSSILSAIEDMNNGYGNGLSDIQPVLHIYFKEKPEMLSGQQFVIELSMETGAVIRDTTVFFYLKP